MPTNGEDQASCQNKRIIDRHLDLEIVIAHLAQPPVRSTSYNQLGQLWQEQVLLARHPNVWFDLSALPAYSETEDYPYPTACQYIRRAVKLAQRFENSL